MSRAAAHQREALQDALKCYARSPDGLHACELRIGHEGDHEHPNAGARWHNPPRGERFFCSVPACDENFEHSAGDCEVIDGRCAELIAAGWRPVWIRMHAGKDTATEQYVLGWGAWVCPMHVREFKLKAPRRSRAKAVQKGSSRT